MRLIGLIMAALLFAPGLMSPGSESSRTSAEVREMIFGRIHITEPVVFPRGPSGSSVVDSTMRAADVSDAAYEQLALALEEIRASVNPPGRRAFDDTLVRHGIRIVRP